MKNYAGKNTLNILKIKLLKILCCCIRQSPIQVNICFCNCIIRACILILTLETMHGKVQPGETLKKIYSQQKHVIQVVYSKDRLLHTRELFQGCKVLNIYQINIQKNLVLLCIKLIQILYLQFFLNKFKRPTHNYLTHFARFNYSTPSFKLNKSKYRISIRGLTLCKNIPIHTEKRQ